ncbi:uncharacterized protein LOC144915506 [Branchiostoma floridae x Branchiostoma belcheri]|nr:hypothetical protein Bbelb_358510 [Branchiostoma belcheri]
MALCGLVLTLFSLHATSAITAPPLNTTGHITTNSTAVTQNFTDVVNATTQNNGTAKDCNSLFAGCPGREWEIPVLASAGAVLLGLIVFFVVFCVRRHKRPRQRNLENGTPSYKRQKIKQELAIVLSKRSAQPPAPLPRRGRVVSDAAAGNPEHATEITEPLTPQYLQLDTPIEDYLVPGQPVLDADQDYDYACADTQPCTATAQGQDGYLEPGVPVDPNEDYENSDVCKYPVEDYENSEVWTSGASSPGQNTDRPEYVNAAGPVRQESELYEDVLVPDRKSKGSKGKGARASLKNAWNKYINVGFRRQQSVNQDDDIYEDTCVPQR